MLAAEPAKRIVEAAILGSHPGLGICRSARQPAPAPSPIALVEGESQPDRMQPGTGVRAIEAVPGTEGAQVGVLREVERGLAVPDDGRQPRDQSWVVLSDRGDEQVIAGGGCCVHVGDCLHLTWYNSRRRRILAGSVVTEGVRSFRLLGRQAEEVVGIALLRQRERPVVALVSGSAGAQQAGPGVRIGLAGELSSVDRKAVISGRTFEAGLLVDGRRTWRRVPRLRGPLRVGLDSHDAATVQLGADRLEQPRPDAIAILG